MKMMKRAALAALATAAVPAAVDAAVMVRFSQAGSDVLLSAAGTLDLTGLIFLGSGPIGAGIQPSGGDFLMGPTGESETDLYFGAVAPASFGTGEGVQGSSGTGDRFGIFSFIVPDALFVPAGFVSGGATASTTTFADQTFATLGLTPGSYTYILPNDTVTLNIDAPVAGAVPEPAAWALMIAGVGAVGGAMRRRRTAARVRFA